MHISPLEWGLVRPADFFCAFERYNAHEREREQFMFGLIRMSTAKIVYPFLKESSRHADLDKFWMNPFAEAPEVKPMTEEERQKSIAQFINKVRKDGKE